MSNILFVIGKYPNYGGTEKVTTVLANEFVKKGHGVSIVSFEQPHLELKREMDASIELFKLNYPVHNKKNVATLSAILSNKEIDIIINQWCLPFYVTRLINKARKDKNCILISALHGLPHQNKRLLNVANKIKSSKFLVQRMAYTLVHKTLQFLTGVNLKYVYHKSDQYVVLSESFIAIFEELSGIREKSKLRAISNPITIELPTNFEQVKDSKEKMILYVGRMDYANKRVHRVIEAWETICSSHPDWSLVLVGDGPEKVDLIAYVESHGIPNVVFEGFKEEPPIEFYKKASILLLTSDLEGFGLVVIEGMIYGVVPIVYGSYSAIYDIISRETSGFITPTPYKNANTVEHMEHLILNPDVLATMSTGAHEEAQRFALPVIVQQWESMFQSLLEH